jgi:DNA-binding transcriptional LysR family regulator
MRTDLNELAAFIAVARYRSFRKAAEERNVSPSTLSHAMRALEDRLGTRLLNRTTRSVVLTEAGSLLLKRIASPLSELAQALDEVGAFSALLKGTLRLNVPRPAGRLLLAPVLSGFLGANPHVRVEIVTDDGMVDIVERGFDAGVRFGERVALDMISVPLGPPQHFAVVASQAYIRKNGIPLTPDDLKQHACIGRRFPSGVVYAWEFSRDSSSVAVRVDGPLTLDDDDMMVRVALAGGGIAFVHESFAAHHLVSGDLVRVLDDWCAPMPGFYLYYPSRRHISAVLRAFIDWCLHYYR